jgi:transcriptional regulator with XRE-family HTH domain
MWRLGNDSSNGNGASLALRGDLRMIRAKVVDEFADQIGGRLQQARENAGLNVDDVIFKTRIPRTVIEALEAGDFSVFSSPTYAKSFLAQYSGFLNVDAEPWLEALQPASFISGDTVSPLWQASHPKKDARPPDPVASSGWFSAVILLGISCGVILAAIKGYEFFDSRLGEEAGPVPAKLENPGTLQNPRPPADLPATVGEPNSAVQAKPAQAMGEDAFVEPAPRARVVR